MSHDALVAAAAEAIAPHLAREPEALITLGSGLGEVADAVREPVDIPTSAIPGVPGTTVTGHAGLLRGGWIADRYVLVQRGRSHLYEGHDAATVTRLVEAAAVLGCGTYVVTNASGGLRPDLSPGALVVIRDHLNLTGRSPLTGVVRGGAPVFVDMAAAYDDALREAAVSTAREHGLAVGEGVYAGLPGPAYETPAEVEMLRRLGADIVGMSTVLEVIAARARGVRVLGLSVVTNVHGAGVSTSHEEVLEVGTTAGRRLGRVVIDVLARL